MIREELKKLYIKHLGMIITAIVVIGEILLMNISYQQKRFVTPTSELNYYEYMDEFSGKLTPDRKASILAEQERIVDAQNTQFAIERKLLNGAYESENEFIAEYEKVCEITRKKESFDLVMEKVSYAEKSPENRYLTMGEYIALGQDFPDILMLVSVIILTAFLFLNEETSSVITFIKITENGRRKTFLGKIIALFVFIISCQVVRVSCEWIMLILQGNPEELAYPIQSVEFFQNCPYNITLLQGFFVISALRTVGYFFVAAFVVLLSVTLRKVLFTVFIPSAVCILQQFAFSPATPAYYLPTGFLRAVGYLRGDVISENDNGEQIKLFAEIPLAHLIVLLVLTLIFIAISVKIASNYYSCKSKKKIHLKATLSLILSCGILSGCSAEKSERIIYNLAESAYFAQDENSYYVSDMENIVSYSKDSGEGFDLIHSAFDNSDTVNSLFKYNNSLLYMQNFVVNEISLSDYSLKQFYSENSTDTEGFLGIDIVPKNDYGKTGGMILGFFVVDKSIYYVMNNRVLKDGACIIDEPIYKQMLCCDGRNIFYINSLLQLKRYDIKMGEISRLSGEFVRTLYFDGTRILFSDRNGIYELSAVDFSTKKISDVTAVQLCSSDSEIFYSKDNAIYRLGSDEPIYDELFSQFAIMDNDILVVRNTDFSCKTVDLS